MSGAIDLGGDGETSKTKPWGTADRLEHKEKLSNGEVLYVHTNRIGTVSITREVDA